MTHTVPARKTDSGSFTPEASAFANIVCRAPLEGAGGLPAMMIRAAQGACQGAFSRGRFAFLQNNYLRFWHGRRDGAAVSASSKFLACDV
jgi:hypothetical protein